MREHREEVVDLLGGASGQRSLLVREVILERMARALASQGSTADFEACARLLAQAPEQRQVDRLMTGIEQGLEGRRLSSVPVPLERPLSRAWQAAQPSPPARLIRFAARLGSAAAISAAEKRCRDPGLPTADRIALIDLLGQLVCPSSEAVLLDILAHDPSSAIQIAAVSALGVFPRPEVGEVLIERYAKADLAVRERILNLLCGRHAWTTALLDAIAKQRLAARDLNSTHVQQVVRLGDPALVSRLESYWGKIPRSGSPEKVRRIAEVRGLLPEGDKGNAARGKPVFREQCAVCHRLFGEGENIGPELTGADRGNLDFLLTSIVDPSASIRKEYQSQTVALQDGRVLSGLVVDENDQSLTIINGDRQRTVLPRSQVDEIKPSDVSLMPEGLLEKLKESQVRDLFRYLQGSPPP
jgi:putative heme-binding domain-containing protein